ncbi:hypothetical protein E4U43_000089 [Claviceps pusilla]|uniref:Uncharacterized protein n=1 Tax=Claviceps pusilla TaxID=123648 RepID=A0A9P7NCK2_9HYPO|nr:hypothetical protein E4U43_000089 [Claviceps pusilla]
MHPKGGLASKLQTSEGSWPDATEHAAIQQSQWQHGVSELVNLAGFFLPRDMKAEDGGRSLARVRDEWGAWL